MRRNSMRLFGNKLIYRMRAMQPNLTKGIEKDESFLGRGRGGGGGGGA